MTLFVIPPKDENPNVTRVLQEGRVARLRYEESLGKGERDVKPCGECGDPIEPARVLLGCVTCACCSPHKGVIRP